MSLKNLSYLSITLIILVALYFITRNKNSTFKNNKIDFALEDANSVSSIKVENYASKLRLTRTENKWKLEDGTPANSSKISTLLGALQNLSMQAPVSKNKLQQYGDTLFSSGIKVTLLRDNKQIYELSFLTINNKNIGMLANGNPFYIEIRGFSHLLLSQLVSINKVDWKDNLLIHLEKEQIATITVKNNLDIAESFIIKTHPGLGLFDGLDQAVAEYSNELLSDYLHFFSGISYTQPNFIEFSIFKSVPDFELDITSTTNETMKVQTYKLLNNTTRKEDKYLSAAVVNNSDTVFLSYSDLDPILTNKNYFLKK